MASPTTPMHGKLGALYVLRPNGYEGGAATLGLNDVTWGLAATNAATAYYEAVIDGIDLMATVTLGVGGTGYTVNDVLTVVQSGASGGTVTVTSVAAGVITGVSLTTGGTGYSIANGLAVTGGTGANATINITAIADSMKWRKNGGGWTTLVTITGAAQTLDEGQTITFAATTGHTLADQWIIGNLKVEPTTVAGNTAQITAAASRIINPNAPPIWTPTNAVNLLSVNYTTGMATFDGAPGVTTVEGNNGMVPRAALQKVAYLIDWNLSVSLDMADASRMGQNWKEALPGQAGATGGANAYFVGTETMFFNLQNHLATSGPKYFFMELYNYDPDQDQTGDHYLAWATFTGFNMAADIGSVVKESLNFQVIGEPSFMANA